MEAVAGAGRRAARAGRRRRPGPLARNRPRGLAGGGRARLPPRVAPGHSVAGGIVVGGRPRVRPGPGRAGNRGCDRRARPRPAARPVHVLDPAIRRRALGAVAGRARPRGGRSRALAPHRPGARARLRSRAAATRGLAAAGRLRRLGVEARAAPARPARRGRGRPAGALAGPGPARLGRPADRGRPRARGEWDAGARGNRIARPLAGAAAGRALARGGDRRRRRAPAPGAGHPRAGRRGARLDRDRRRARRGRVRGPAAVRGTGGRGRLRARRRRRCTVGGRDQPRAAPPCGGDRPRGRR